MQTRSLELSATPCAEAAVHLRHEMDRRLCASVKYLLGVAESSLQSSFTRVRETIDTVSRQVNEGATLSPEAFANHHLLHSAMKANDSESVVSVLDSFAFPAREPAVHITSFPPLDSTSAGERAIARVIKSENERQYQVTFHAGPAQGPSMSASVLTAERVLALLEEHDPETYAEACHLVQRVAIADTESLRAGTSFFAFGLISLASLRPSQSWTAYLEFIVHEAAHHVLFAHWTQNAMIKNEATPEYRSPLRARPRPLSGIFHAAFVLARTIRAKRLFEKIPGIGHDVRQMSTGYNEAGNAAPFETKFLDCVDVLTQHAELTESGSMLLRSCREMVSL